MEIEVVQFNIHENDDFSVRVMKDKYIVRISEQGTLGESDLVLNFHPAAYGKFKELLQQKFNGA